MSFKQKLDTKLAPYQYYLDIVLICMGLFLILVNMILVITVRYYDSTIASLFGGVMLLILGLKDIKADSLKRKGKSK
jgi:hypothetical protein